ncbi:MAG TPA: hypothetical protein VGJ30_12200, partial [Candidatus Angelobacter sp.]
MFAIALGLQQPQHFHIGEIALFGTIGINVQKLQSALPIPKGELTDEQISELFERIDSTVNSALGHKPTDVRMVCCN